MKRFVPAATGAILMMVQFGMAAGLLDSWTPYNPGGDVTLQAVCYGGDMFVAVGYASVGLPNGQDADNAVIFTSYDGITWNREDVTNVNWLSGIAYGNGKFVAAGQNSDPHTEYNNVVLTSQDGSKWSQTGVATGYWIGGVCYGNGLFAAAAGIRGTAAILTSSNGASWTEYDFGHHPAYGVAYGSNGFLAVELDGETIASSGGSHWDLHAAGGNYETRSVAFGNGLYVAAGNSCSGDGPICGAILTSPEGTAWTPRADGSTNLMDTYLYGCAYCPGQFVVTGEGGLMLTSPDGVNWTKRNTGTDGDLMGVACGNGVYVAVGSVVLTTGQISRPVVQAGAGSNGQPVMQVLAPAGYNVSVQSSTDLVEWSPFAVLTNTNGSVLFTDPGWTNTGGRFFRATVP